MKRRRKEKRLLAIILSVLLTINAVPAMVFAEGQPNQGICEHHPEHTADCGYVEALPCGHEHTEDCYTDKLTCGYKDAEEATASDSDAEHTHTQECYELDCPHEQGEHDDFCGYVGGSPCEYPCELCKEPTNDPETKPEDMTGQTACTLTEGCTLADGHEGLCVTQVPPVNGVPAKTIADWTFIDDDYLTEGELALPGVNAGRQANFDTVVSMLPTQIRAEVKGEADPILVDITDWSCLEFAKGPDGNWPLTGEYTFTAELAEGYACEPMPTVKVLVGGAELYAAETGDFTVTGNSTDYEFKDPVLTIKSGSTVTIQNTNPNAPTTHRIKVAENATNVNITLAGVNIDLSAVNTVGQACAFDMTGASVNLTLAGGSSNFLISNSIYAGLQVPEGATLTVDGTGELEAVCEVNGAGIGSCQNQSGGNITIQGSVQVRAIGGYGAGIGSGNARDGNGGNITIKGNAEVTATSDWGAGIGGGFGGNSGAITIQNSAQVTAESNLGAGIGGGLGGNGGAVTIQNSAQVTATSNRGAGIGGGEFFDGTIGRGGKGGDVVISGENTRVVARSEAGNDIGSGSGCTVGGTLKVTGGATLEMQNSGTNVNTPEYKECTVIDSQSTKVEYDTEGKVIPALSLEADPEGSLELPGDITLTAFLSGAASGNGGRIITFTVNGTPYTDTTTADGKATCTVTSPLVGTYTFGASFAGDAENKQVAATEITRYLVKLGTQNALTLNGLDSAYTYGDAGFTLSTSGGSGNGAVSYVSSNSAVASVTGDQVTIHKAGTFTITATKAADSNYAKAAVTSPGVTVSEATPNVSLATAGGSTTSEALILTATVSKAGAGAVPAGTVTFKQENTLLGTVTLDGSGQASHTINSPTAGSHKYTVEYSGQTGYYKAASASRTIGVELTDQTGFAITDPGAKTYGDSDFTLTTTGGQGTGSVSFSAPSGNGVLTVEAGGAAKITGAGKVTVTAAKDADSTYNQATATLEITVAPRDISHVTVAVKGSRIYMGSQLQPVFEVKDGAIAITTGDYTNSYGPNVDAGTGAGSITLTGQRNYTGTKEVRFDIEKRSLAGAVVTLEPGPYRYTGTEVKPAVTGVTLDGIVIPVDALDVAYTDHTGTGIGKVTVSGKEDSNYTGSASTTFEITRYSSSDSDSSDDDSYTNPDILRGSWIQTETGTWMFRQTDGSYARNRWGMVDGLWYFFDAEGKMLTGWQFLGGQWYYLCTKEDLAAKAGMKEGAMASGWYFDPVYQQWFYLEANGTMATGWREVNGKWYYLNPVSDGTRGAMVTDRVVDGRYVDKNGVWNWEA